MTPANLYDEIAYPTEVYRQTHPARLATAAVLMGMKPTPPERCRVLELGCGSGINLLAMALSLPDSEFVGIDLAALPIAQARSASEACGLRNATFLQRDLLDDCSDLGCFDYVVAHGIYSWTPPPVRDRVLAICEQSLTEQGVAFVSYSVYPGAFHRRLAREVLRYHTPDTQPAHMQLERTHDLLNFLADAMPTPAMYREIFRQEKALLQNLGDGHYLHDNLNHDNEPVYFHEFMAHASRHRLQYLDDSAANRLLPGLYPPAVIDKLTQLSPSRVGREQYRDFLDGRLFRETLLCRQDVTVAETPRTEQVRNLYVLTTARPMPAPAESAPSAAVSFQLSDGQKVQIEHPLVIAALIILTECSPGGISFGELLTRTQVRLGSGELPALDLAEMLLIGEGAGLVELTVYRPPVASAVSARPVASPVARWQIGRNKPVTNLWNCSISMDDPLTRHLLTLLDGSRDRTALADALATYMEQQQLFPRRNDLVIREPAALRSLLAGNMDSNLERFARLCLLVA